LSKRNAKRKSLDLPVYCALRSEARFASGFASGVFREAPFADSKSAFTTCANFVTRCASAICARFRDASRPFGRALVA
jgi:hypothetical protein